MKNFFILFAAITAIFFFTGCINGTDQDKLSLEGRGDLAFARREYKKAAGIWLTAYSKHPKDISLISRLGDCYLKLGRLERAKKFFEKAVKINPAAVDMQIKLARIYILTWNLPGADKICTYLENTGQISPELFLIKADLSLMNHQPDRAEAFYRRAVIGSKDSLRSLMKLAVFLKSVNKHEQAGEILKIVQKSNIVSSQIYLLMADYYLLDNQYNKAQKALKDAVRLEPADNSLKYHLVQFYIATSNNTKAETLLKSLVENQNDIYLKMMLADVYILNNKLKKAQHLIIKLKEQFTEPPVEFELLQGKFWLYSGKPVFAAEYLESALELNPGLVNTRYLLGLTYLINGKIKLSENMLTRTLQIFPDHYNALLLISQLLYKKKEYGLSLKYIERFLKKYPEDFNGHIIKGLDLLGQKKYSFAENEFDKSVLLTDNAYIAYYYSGLTQELMNHGAKALKFYKKVIENHPDLIDVSFRYGMLLVKMKQTKIARTFMEQKLAKQTILPEDYFLVAKMSLKAGHFAKAELFLKKAVQLDNAPGFIFMELADLYQTRHERNNTIKVLEQCIKKLPYFPDAWLALSHIYLCRNDLVMALEIMHKGYKKFKQDPFFQSNLAWLLLQDNQQTNLALSLAQSAYEKIPKNPALADTLGWAYYHKKIYSQALWLLSEAEQKVPGNGFVQYHLGMTYFQKGDIEKACQYLKKAKKSRASVFFADKIDSVLSDLLKIKQKDSKVKVSVDKNLILSPPETGNEDEDMIIPQWKQ